ncbi:hypothetical protein HPB49_011065 [Dermacentor silvarum]|uniref:Uncharacterized protein n=1 Tax=Dermacentor silvarum TaxID=543639 RepID=A0ACB8C392_DERSI|nr:hypothetical protein HPB49_011065 [Dermacentor silvarum]
MAADVKKRTSLTFAAKLEVIQCIENGEKKASVAEAFDISRSTLSEYAAEKQERHKGQGRTEPALRHAACSQSCL